MSNVTNGTAGLKVTDVASSPTSLRNGWSAISKGIPGVIVGVGRTVLLGPDRDDVAVGGTNGVEVAELEAAEDTTRGIVTVYVFPSLPRTTSTTWYGPGAVPKGAVPVTFRGGPTLIQSIDGDVVEIDSTVSLGLRKYGTQDISKGTPGVIVGVGRLGIVGPAPGDVVVAVGVVTVNGKVTV